MAPVISEHSFIEMMKSFSKLSDDRLGQLIKQGKDFVPQSVAETVARGYWNSAVIHMVGDRYALRPTPPKPQSVQPTPAQSRPQPAAQPAPAAPQHMSSVTQPAPAQNASNSFFNAVIGRVETPKVKDPLTRTGLFVKDMNIYILDGVQRQTGHKLAAFRLSVNNVVKEAIDSMDPEKQDELLSELALANGGNAKRNPCIKIYVNCPDAQIDTRANKILESLASAKCQGVELDINIVGNGDAAWARVLPNVERYVVPQPLVNIIEHQSQK